MIPPIKLDKYLNKPRGHKKEPISHDIYGIHDLYNIQDLYQVLDLDKGFEFFRPLGFLVALRGGWLNPMGRFAANVAVNYDHLTLTALYFSKQNYQGKEVDIALHRGWVRFSYWQSYSKHVLNTHQAISKRLIIELDRDQCDFLTMQRLYRICKEYYDMLPRIKFEIRMYDTKQQDGIVTATLQSTANVISPTFVKVILQGALSLS